MAFLNRIRLPLYLKTPQFPTEANRFRLSDGTTKTLSVTIKKTYALQTDYMGEAMHQRLVIALNHDTVNIEGDRYIGGVSVDGEYELTWPDFLDYPLAQGAALLEVTPFNFTNDNCQTCEQASQLALVDDDAGEIAEGATASVMVYENDNICCFPITAEIVSFNNDYLASATINQATGEVQLTAKDPAISVGSIIMATYRVTCPDGTYDEANIYASIDGSEDGCEQPTNIVIELSDPPAPFTLNASWTPPGTPPLYYEWELFVDGFSYGTGTAVSPEIFGSGVTGLSGNTNYVFSVRSVCAEGVYSPYESIEFTTPSGDTGNCGNFQLVVNDGTTASNFYQYSYMDCNGIIQNATELNLDTVNLCMLMDSFNNPIYFASASPVFTINYLEPC